MQPIQRKLQWQFRVVRRPGYWYRAGYLRRAVRSKLGDALIVQTCLDHDIPLITYDSGFRRFVPAGLKLVIEEV